MKTKDLVFPKESYQIIGIAMEIHSELGNIYQEINYQRVFEEKLRKLDIAFEREKKVIVKTKDGCEVGEFKIDFIVDNKVLLEFKRVNFIHFNDTKQVLRYLKATNLKLGIIINFKLNRLQYKRIINADYK
ncbi:MAG: hypothetical protein UT50_C0011G0007 [Candidatus Moranbacteria bacterium GW2011_GWA2_39_41]|nr:MAG: hypothetical protein UT50_C0011G0007 [Candidatus Moranbacteria bacterium GW2011_GWA2_39_41]